MGQLYLNNVRKNYGHFEVIKGVQLDIKDGEFVVFVGPSGCGKSTLLRMIAGLEDISGGDVVINGVKVNELPPVKRGIAMVFQSYALYPHMSVFENIAFPLRVEKMEESKIKEKVEGVAKILQLDQRLEQRPGMLSGGQRQRVAIGRAIVREPKIFLFDEPLSNLDAALRADMRIELTNLHRTLKATMIYVTHDQVEAMTMADRIVVLNAGEIAQVGAPLELYHKPANLFVAGFIGNPKMNFLKVTCVKADADGVTVDYQGQQITVPVEPRAGLEGSQLTLGIRPEHTGLEPADLNITVAPSVIERLGVNTIAYGVSPTGENYCALLSGSAPVVVDEPIVTGIKASDCHLFDDSGIALDRRVDLSVLKLIQ
ncbi:sn-glycerol-3-phosphate ABC transporter ATP-binding protein UgpC [Rhizobium sp. RM]|uniref:ABC transporter ATP-binding protein n=1 Tax=Rhizobium sp. RM TaxID=2748079 RepID=UPI00110E4D26|nr:sn-glycerol-3-phosphate ABC transporter ATP-binding protein UgpC [Rhizobium sp. RM]NWJ23362.1 sn-glycerol-3-phosphate ABC transporter ATP-binding protein UgpC [Rhizobium sp. RM]TMV14230.1 sn-glycerol-3-phosphate ABC transporter ATP-binding protein UgpC [Rhizobium sp. Td3]